jgi:hypothetical protein
MRERQGLLTLHRLAMAMLVILLGCLILNSSVVRSQAAGSLDLVAHLQERFGLTDRQVRGGLGALLVFCRDKLTKTDFDALALRIPNAESAMQAVKMQGVVTGPLDNIDDFEATLSSLGIGQPLASQFAPAVLEHLAATGRDTERNILASVLD